MRELNTFVVKMARTPLALFALALVVAVPWFATRAQHSSRDPQVNVTGVTSRPAGGGEVVSITADAPLSRAQTWQDDEGFHVVGYKWVGAFGGAPRGVKVRRVGDSLELVVPTHAGARVTVQPHANTLDVVVSGGMLATVEPAPKPFVEHHTPTARASQQTDARALNPKSERSAKSITTKKQANASTKELLTGGAGWQKTSDPRVQVQPAQAKGEGQAKNDQQAKSDQQIKSEQPGNQQGAQNMPAQTAVAGVATQAAPVSGVQPPPAQTVAQVGATPLLINAVGSTGVSSWSSSLVVIVSFLGLGLVAFLFILLKHLRTAKRAGEGETVDAKASTTKKTESGAKATVARDKTEEGKDATAVVKTATGAALVKQEPKHVAPISVPPVLFGAFRIEQEVDKLVRGETHAIAVIASRATDDRRAVEASLLKALGSPELSEAEHTRARTALEEYGFVARQSAAVLLSPDAYGRSAAARTLGQVKSQAALPFLLEALYDADTVVRTEAVASLGTLGLPRAIGALLDTARRHADIPNSLLTHALNACSVDPLDFSDDIIGDAFDGEIEGLEPVAAIDQLPEWLEDETLADALERLAADDVEARVAAAQQLAQFQVQRSVDALAAMAARDVDSSVRATAVTSLGLINHESVFASILIAMADESREVRAAAARALSRLSFDRADAYVRVLETSDAETLERTAEACVTAGLARQAMDRLASEDRRQAYEAFSLLALVARGGQSEVILTVVKAHPDLNARLAASRLLALQGDEEVSNKLRRLAMEGNTPEKLRETILEVCERRGQGALGATATLTNEDDKRVQPIA
ncbi:MAG: HEAT repeat domain-containing protein [Pyrinomonadaceae bacterium]